MKGVIYMNALQKPFPVLRQEEQENLDTLNAILPIKAGLDKLVQAVTGQVSEYFLKIVEMQRANPINPIIFAPHIEINVNSNNKIDARQRNCGNTNIDAKKYDCDNTFNKDSFNKLEYNSIYQKLIYFQQDCNNNYAYSTSRMGKKSILKFRE